MLFLVNMAFYWAVGGTIDMIKEKKAKKKAEQQ